MEPYDVSEIRAGFSGYKIAIPTQSLCLKTNCGNRAWHSGMCLYRNEGIRTNIESAFQFPASITRSRNHCSICQSSKELSSKSLGRLTFQTSLSILAMSATVGQVIFENQLADFAVQIAWYLPTMRYDRVYLKSIDSVPFAATDYKHT